MSAVQSADGTSISYFSQGSGPDVIVIPGVLSVAHDLAPFIAALAERHTVHAIDRRGRGESGPQGRDYGMAKECEDVEAVCRVTQAKLIFGHSYGGLIALEFVKRRSGIDKIAVYEPGLSINGSIPSGWMADYKQSLTRGRNLRAFSVFTRACGPASARGAPLWLMEIMIPIVVARDRLARMLHLLHENLREHEVIAGLDNSIDGYNDITAQILLMRGGKSRLPWVSMMIDRMRATIPPLRVEVFPGADHFAPMQGAPEDVAEAVKSFFA